jgi:hypothetical protein
MQRKAENGLYYKHIKIVNYDCKWCRNVEGHFGAYVTNLAKAKSVTLMIVIYDRNMFKVKTTGTNDINLLSVFYTHG